jgi:hypothetical protein
VRRQQEYACVDDVMKHNLENEMNKHKHMLNQHDRRIILIRKKAYASRFSKEKKKRNDTIQIHIEILKFDFH